MKLAGCKIVGGPFVPRGHGVFDRALPILECPTQPTSWLQVRRYVGVDEVEGNRLDAEDWQALLRAQQLVTLPPVDALNGAAIWLFRQVFARREAALEELRASGVLFHNFQLDDGSWACLVREPEANFFRDAWMGDAVAAAKSWAMHGFWNQACGEATQAFVLDPDMHPERLALLILTYEQMGNIMRAQGYLQMAERSRGAEFAAQTKEHKVLFEQELKTNAKK